MSNKLNDVDMKIYVYYFFNVIINNFFLIQMKLR